MPYPSNFNIVSIKSLENNPGFSKFKISQQEISPAEKHRTQIIKSSNHALSFFQKMLCEYKQFPSDKSFANVLVALKNLNKLQEAEELFDFLEEKTKEKFKDKVVGPYSYSARLGILRAQIKKTEKLEDKKQLLNKATALWERCKQLGYTKDRYIVTDMMCIYTDIEHVDQAIELFWAYQKDNNKPDLYMYSEYIVALIKLNRLDEACEKLEYATQKYCDDNNIYKLLPIYNLLMIAFFESQKDELRALEWFEKGLKKGLYKNNQLQKNEHNIKLDFHLSKDYKNIEGGLPVAVAKIALLFFVKQMAIQGIHSSAEVITGGHNDSQAKLKAEFPDYLKKEYDIGMKWNDNPHILSFVISYEDVRKMRLTEDILFFASQNGIATEAQLLEAAERLIGQYYADLRHANEGRSFKQASKAPVVPSEFKPESKKLAEQALQYFRVRDYGAAQKTYVELVKQEPHHPWSYIEWGFVLHRQGEFDEAINQYQTAIEVCGDHKKYAELNSEAHRKMGWAYDRKNKLNEAEKHYQFALELNPDNLETHNNRGMLYEKKGAYDKAITEFEKVIHQDPRHDEVCVHAGDCCKKKNDHQNAEKYYQEAIRRSEQYDNGKSAAWAYACLGDLYYLQYKDDQTKTNIFNKAKTAFENSLNKQVNRKEALQGLKDLYELKEDTDKIKEYQTKLDKLSVKETPKLQKTLQHYFLRPPNDNQQPSKVNNVPLKSNVKN